MEAIGWEQPECPVYRDPEGYSKGDVFECGKLQGKGYPCGACLQYWRKIRNKNP